MKETMKKILKYLNPIPDIAALFRRLAEIHAANHDQERRGELEKEAIKWWFDEAFMRTVARGFFWIIWIIAGIDCVVKFPW